MYVVAHKSDRGPEEWAVDTEEGEAFAESIGAGFFYASSKTGKGCRRDRSVDIISQALLKRTRSSPVEQSPAAGTKIGFEDEMSKREGRFWY